MVKDIFLHNVANVTHSRMSHFETTQDILNLLKDRDPDRDPSYPVLRFSDNLSSRNQDMAQNVNLQVHDVEIKSMSLVKVNNILQNFSPMSIHVKIH